MNLAFVADKGGVGKSTLAYHVATRLRQLGADVAIVDLDRRSACTKWNGADHDPYVPAYPLGTAADQLPAHEVQVWDTPAHPTAELCAVLAELCDLVVIVAQTDADSQEAAAELCQRLLAAGAHPTIVINEVQPTSSAGRDSVAALRGYQLPCLDATVRRYACYERARWDSRAVCDYPYPSADQAWSDIAALTAAILTTIGDRHAEAAA